MNIKLKILTSVLMFSISQNLAIFASSKNVDSNTTDITCLETKGDSFKNFLDGLMVKAFENKSSKSSIANAMSSYYTYKSKKRYGDKVV